MQAKHQAGHKMTSVMVQNFLQSGWIFAVDADFCWIGGGELQNLPSCKAEVAIYAQDFYLRDQTPWISSQWSLQISRQELKTLLIPFATSKSELQWSLPHWARTEELFGHFKSNSELEKFVGWVEMAGEGKVVVESSLIKLLDAPSPLKIYGYWQNNRGVLGATPEWLFYRNSPREIKTMALAGTLPKEKGAGGGERLLADAKERHEHQLVVDDVLAQLSQLGKASSQTTRVLELPTLFHLLTEIECELHGDFSFEDLVYRLHPTPALGTFPRQADLRALRQADTALSRGFFGAPFGIQIREPYFQGALVAIRGCQWQDSHARILAGSGWVAESQWENEKHELERKINATRAALSI